MNKSYVMTSVLVYACTVIKAYWSEKEVVNDLKVDLVQLRRTHEEFEREERSLNEMCARLDEIATSLRLNFRGSEIEQLASKLGKKREALVEELVSLRKMRNALELVHGTYSECERQVTDNGLTEDAPWRSDRVPIAPGIVNFDLFQNLISNLF